MTSLKGLAKFMPPKVALGGRIRADLAGDSHAAAAAQPNAGSSPRARLASSAIDAQ